MCVLVQQFGEADTAGGNEPGFSVAVKDSIHIAGYPTQAGCKALADAAPAEKNAAVVDALLDAGCVIVGKTNMHELAFGMTGINNWSGTPANERFPEYIPGGSSSGSAVAVAAGVADFTLGTDTGGSIRVPAACCGIYGLKPTFGRVSRMGVLPESTSLDCVGPFADSAEMLIEAMKIIDSHFDPATLAELSSITVGVVTAGADPAIWSVINTLLKRSGLTQVAVELPTMQSAFDAGMAIINRETWQAFSDLAQSAELGKDVSERLNLAAQTSDEAISSAELVRDRFTREVDQLLSKVDFLVLPTLPHFPLFLADAKAGKTDLNISALVRPFNLSGHPALSVPLVAEGNRPAGLQIVGKKGSDEQLCELARQLSRFISNPKKPNKK
ncbi:amidase [uncultured Neptuniibacter sp.]|uniref:amidase n=1 Tax=uncultured Neptuniibacter sp. TaxID=502143 RepID=UPI00262EC20F|nr:amidase [uncultured Neptuniibacter sp.]